jgi:hypothetical protein
MHDGTVLGGDDMIASPNRRFPAAWKQLSETIALLIIDKRRHRAPISQD